MDQAAGTIRRGGLVAFPTETVYGLGANALDAAAVQRIYEAKGRPAHSPLIVHVSSIEMAESLVEHWPDAARILAKTFWPGPLTLVLRKLGAIPDIVTAGLPTVGLRMPDHPVALQLIREAGVPIAAPSANRFMGLSPTTADHVRAGMGDLADCILDGGETRVGIESTVLSLAGDRPVLLRPGMVHAAQIEALIGPIQCTDAGDSGEAHASPGLHRKHYSPATPLIMIRHGRLPGGRGAYLWYKHSLPAAFAIQMPGEAAGYAHALYRSLHELDAGGWEWIAVEAPPNLPEWAAVNDRLTRAAEAS